MSCFQQLSQTYQKTLSGLGQSFSIASLYFLKTKKFSHFLHMRKNILKKTKKTSISFFFNMVSFFHVLWYFFCTQLNFPKSVEFFPVLI